MTSTMKPALLASTLLAALLPLSAGAKPLKVYILAGQSNMEGHAQTMTFPAMAKDPATKNLYDKIVDAEGKPKVFEDIPISYSYGDFGGTLGERKSGKLSVGWGSQHHVGTGKIGPELTFGITMHELEGEPILLIKNAWGGKSLMVDFRPPSAGDLPDDHKNKDKAGAYYKGMMDHVKDVLADPKKVYPEYNEKEGYEIAGFVWFQGFNDLVGPYPLANSEDPKSKTKDYSEYSRLLACFIRDVRKDLNAPKMPFVIGVLGVGGMEPNEGKDAFRKAMAAPAAMDEFKGSVVAVDSAPFWPADVDAVDQKISELKKPFNKRLAQAKKLEGEEKKKANAEISAEIDAIIDKELSEDEKWLLKNGKSNAAYHYMGSAKFFAQLGEAFAKALHGMEK